MSERKYTTLDHVTFVEGHDDLYRGHRPSFLGSVLSRTMSQAFYPFLNTWPQVKVNGGMAPEESARAWYYTVEVRYEHFILSRDFNAGTYWNDKQAFSDQLDAFAKDMSEVFLELERKGEPWWTDHKNNWSYLAPIRHRDRFIKIHHKLAEIKQRGGKFQWHAIPVGYGRDDWTVKEHKQGHAPTLDAAKAAVEAFLSKELVAA